MRLASILIVLSLFAPRVDAHCDSLKGPVILAAREAFAKGDVTPVMKWIMPQYENEIRSAFDRAKAIRATGDDAAKLAELWFFETLVRVHRAGEGAPYEGLKADLDNEALEKADAAVQSGRGGDLEKLILALTREGLHSRFEKVLDAKKHAEESVEAGRRFVAAYVDFIHFVEERSKAASAPVHEHASP